MNAEIRKHRNTETPSSSPGGSGLAGPKACRAGLGLTAACVAFCALVGGCQELVHMGQISDRESSWSVPGVLIEQQQPDGTWSTLGETDGGGRWWVMKEKIHGGGRIRVSKPGYYSRTMRESEFLQENNILLVPGGEGDVEEGTMGQWQLGPEGSGERRSH
jgi:hypothetical protein